MYQQCTIVGNLGRDPELRYTSSGQPVADFTVAVNRKWTNQDGTPGEETTWFKISAWGKLAETCNQYLTKGKQVLIVGRVSASAWTGQDGTARATLELNAQEVKFLGGGAGGGTEKAAPGDAQLDAQGEIPF